MSNAVLSHPGQRPAGSIATSAAMVVLAAWLAVVLFLGAQEFFVRPPGEPPVTLLIGFAVPIIFFLVALRGSRSFRDFVLAVDLRLVTAVQAWRFGGLAFLAFYVHGILPGLFAWPAGLGDMAIGATAPWIMLSLIHRPEFVSSRTFRIWNVLGILDLVTAVGVGGLSSLLATGVPGEVTTAPMAMLPLVLIPVYLVPIFVILHVTALYQAASRS
jgi:hypothetical protein